MLLLLDWTLRVLRFAREGERNAGHVSVATASIAVHIITIMSSSLLGSDESSGYEKSGMNCGKLPLAAETVYEFIIMIIIEDTTSLFAYPRCEDCTVMNPCSFR